MHFEVRDREVSSVFLDREKYESKSVRYGRRVGETNRLALTVIGSERAPRLIVIGGRDYKRAIGLDSPGFQPAAFAV